MSEADERIAGGAGVLFDERMLDAHLAVLLHARTTSPDGFPTVEAVDSFARLYGVDALELGASFGLIGWRYAHRPVWVDTVRGTGLVREAVEPIPCLTCRKPFESVGPHNRMCHSCRTAGVSPFAI
ncbi:hypothetical protein NCF86_01595 [Pelagerythrobacter marinus]|nr:hypothetical protein NCF86_01595 [Pelagerythrobacter marinus]